MEFGKMIRTQMVVAGLGMALLCAGATKAQEIVNTRFEDGPNVAAMAQPTPMQAKAEAVSGAQATAQADQAELATLRATDTASTEQGSTQQALWIGTFLIWVGAIGIYFCGPAKRFAREIRSLREKYNVAREA